MSFLKEEPQSCCATEPASNGHDCSTPQPKGKVECPRCSQKSKGVLGKTLEHLLTDEAKVRLDYLDGFYYCKTPTCKVIYFSGDLILTQDDLSVSVGLKEGAEPANMCYCFGWTKQRIKEDLIKNGKSSAIEDIKHNMDTIGCSCEIKNPSGSCCTGDVIKVVKEIEKEIS